MTDELKPPVAIRITRPYATEAEFLEREFDTLTHTSVILLGAQARPQGVVLRFEIVLKNGESMLRGEGRVVGYKEKAYAGEPGLSLRFTRLDSRSKSLVDKASALREARVRASASLMSMPAVVVPKPGASSGAVPPPLSSSVLALDSSPRISTPPPARPSSPPPPSSRRAPPPLPDWARSAEAPPASGPVMDIESTQVDAHFDRAPPSTTQVTPAPKGIRPTPARPPPLPLATPAAASKPPPTRAAARDRGSVDRPAEREVLLARLRTRASSLPAARVREILAKRA